MLSEFFFGHFLVWLPWSFSLVVLVFLVLRYLPEKYITWKLPRRLPLHLVILFLLLATVLFNLFLTALQYYVWSSSAFGRFLLPPHQPIGYFFGYSFFHYWLADIIVLIPALLLFLVLNGLRKYKPAAISREECSLSFLLALIIGWPSNILFIPLFLLLAFMIAVVKNIVFKEKNFRFLPVLLIAALVVFFTGSLIIRYLGLAVLVL